MLEYHLDVERIDEHGSLASVGPAEVVLDTDMNGRDDALSPPELLLAALGACMVRAIQRAQPRLRINISTISIHLRAWRQDSPPAVATVHYRIELGTDADDEMLELLHRNVQKGTIFNTVAAGTRMQGEVVSSG
ncbi:OsmC family protein [Thioalkalivibrio sp.]|uniref:OsmC family protein n=1 Tax=Thioalkalivibrio sp. TaxID=2093813 RepID=UPI003562533F